MAFTGFSDPKVVSLAFQGAVAAMPSNNRQRAINSVIDTQEEIISVVTPAVAYQLAALAFAVAVDTAFDELGGYDSTPATDALLISVCKGLWVNRWAALPIADIPTEDEALETYIQDVNASYGPAVDPATYLPVARSLIVPPLLAVDIIDEGTNGEADLEDGVDTPWSHWAQNANTQNILNGNTDNILSVPFQATKDLEYVEIILTVQAIANGGNALVTVTSPDLPAGFARSINIPSGETGEVTYHAIFTNVPTGDYNWTFTMQVQGGAASIDTNPITLAVLRETQQHPSEA